MKSLKYRYLRKQPGSAIRIEKQVSAGWSLTSLSHSSAGVFTEVPLQLPRDRRGGVTHRKQW